MKIARNIYILPSQRNQLGLKIHWRIERYKKLTCGKNKKFWKNLMGFDIPIFVVPKGI